MKYDARPATILGSGSCLRGQGTGLACGFTAPGPIGIAANCSETRWERLRVGQGLETEVDAQVFGTTCPGFRIVGVARTTREEIIDRR